MTKPRSTTSNHSRYSIGQLGKEALLMRHTSKQSHSNLMDISPEDTNPVYKLAIGPDEQSLVLLGEFDHDAKLRGYSVELTPSPAPAKSFVSQINRVEQATGYKLYLYIANRSKKTISATICEL